KFFPIGTMNVHDEGLLILTNDSFFAKRLALSKFDLDQEFVVEVNRDLKRMDISKMQNGLKLKDGMTKPAKVRQLDMRRFAIILSESKPDLIRRMCAELHYEIETLMRTRILTLKMISTYPIGSWRKLTESEIEDLKKTVGIVVSEKPKQSKPMSDNKKKRIIRKQKQSW
ncbi:MAG: hypothetical protein AAB664_03970, partial [Patescibacteria group bacterium]